MLVFQSRQTTQRFIASKHRLEYLRYAEILEYPMEWIDGRAPPWWERWHRQHDDFGDRSRGFKFRRESSYGVFYIALPYWFICLVTALTPTAWLTVQLRRKRHRPGLCAKCHYDLRATPNRCPECGTIPIGEDSKIKKSTFS